MFNLCLACRKSSLLTLISPGPNSTKSYRDILINFFNRSNLSDGIWQYCQKVWSGRREAAKKKFFFLVDVSTKRGGFKGLSTKEKGTFF